MPASNYDLSTAEDKKRLFSDYVDAHPALDAMQVTQDMVLLVFLVMLEHADLPADLKRYQYEQLSAGCTSVVWTRVQLFLKPPESAQLALPVRL